MPIAKLKINDVCNVYDDPMRRHPHAKTAPYILEFQAFDPMALSTLKEARKFHGRSIRGGRNA